MTSYNEENISASEMLDNILAELNSGMDKCVEFSQSQTDNTAVYGILRGIANAIQYSKQRIEAGDV